MSGHMQSMTGTLQTRVFGRGDLRPLRINRVGKRATDPFSPSCYYCRINKASASRSSAAPTGRNL